MFDWGLESESEPGLGDRPLEADAREAAQATRRLLALP